MLRFAAKPGASLCRSAAGKHCIGHGGDHRSPTTLLRTGVALRDFHNQNHNGARSNHWWASSRRPLMQNQHADFSSELIPLTTTFMSSSTKNNNPIRILGLRHFSDSKKDKPPETSGKEETSSATPTEHASPNTLDPASVAEAGEKAAGGGGIREIVNSVGPRLKKASSDINPGDLISVYGIVTLIAIIVVAPTLIR
jgi:hypothetical protein